MGGRQKETVYLTKCYPEAAIEEIKDYELTKINHTVTEVNGIGITSDLKTIPCTCIEKARMKKILPTTDNQDNVIVHAKCPRNLYTSFLRQLQGKRPETISKICDKEIFDYHEYCDKLFEEEILPLISDFDYKIEPWLNHLKDYNHQKEIEPFYKEYLTGIRTKIEWYNTTYTLFTKEEKQVVTDGKIPKCRAISACPPNIKWIMGPIVIKLEQIFGSKLKGYKYNNKGRQLKTNEEIERYYDECYSRGLTQSQDLDGSRWDTTQYYHMKYLVNKIYNWLANNGKVHHVTPELFIHVSTARYRNLVAKYFEDGKTRILAKAKIDSTTFSGSPDTTFTNTVANASVGRYVFDKAGIESEQFEIFTSGDDYGSLTDLDTAEKLEPIVKDVWSKLGLVLKYYHTGSYETITFCSTNVIQYKEDDTIKHKIVRQIDRMNPLSHWSMKALHYSPSELKYYYDSLYKGVKNWAHDMPFYGDYAKAFKLLHDRIPGPPAEAKLGKPKVYYPTTTTYDESNFEKNKEKWRISNRIPPEHEVYRFIQEKTQMSYMDIREYQYKLVHESNYLPLNP